MRIGGLVKCSLVDYPGKVSAVVFTQGCNFRCPYCHNRQLVYPELMTDTISAEKILSFFETRKRLLDGVVITGGEPLLQNGLREFIACMKRTGYAVKLDTNGSHPVVIEQVLKERLIDYIAIDYKAPLRQYPAVAGCKVNVDDIKKSIEIAVRSGIAYEMRTTIFNGLSADDIVFAMAELYTFGVKNYFLQVFVPSPGCKGDYSIGKLDFEYLLDNLRQRFVRYGIRNVNRS